MAAAGSGCGPLARPTLITGVRLAATLAFTTATTLAGIWTAAETIAGQVPWVVPTFGPFATTGIIVWAVWLLAGVVHALAPLHWTRMTIGLALLLSPAALPVGALVGLPRPPLFVLVPHAALGLLALAMPTDPPRWQRLMPLVVAPLDWPQLTAWPSEIPPTGQASGAPSCPRPPSRCC
ncbi:hypothetical protein MED01_005684 [Micromonospora sp. MED01]|uniref:hypothetical protein n=1 Tax=Micromonospora alfalfae TaxID=2911212 RepID=UPI001EE8044D|nr:hypothetical protein [Micromonospora alfalfae]MCG5466645.1 hypothetical protein [Micromonospora alfalfae]